jgi:hypothetical protein
LRPRPASIVAAGKPDLVLFPGDAPKGMEWVPLLAAASAPLWPAAVH